MELLIANIYYWKNFFQMIFNVYKTFSNYHIVLNKALNGKFPIEAVLRNSNHVSLNTFNAMYVLAFTRCIKEIECDVKNDLVIISSKIGSKKILLHGGINNGDIVYGFLKEDYGKLPIKEKFVIDIGANIGDTQIYFALHGAKKVIGLEPFLKNYEFAKKNIIVNNLSDKITLLLAGCSAKKGFITINPDFQSNHESKLIEFQEGEQIPLFTIEDLFNQHDIPRGSVLKMDCEGCENEIINSASNEILQRFSHIQIEYHSGYKILKEKLEKCGFRVSVTRPIATNVLHTYLESIKKKYSIFNKKSSLRIIDDADNVKHIKNHIIGYTGFLYAVNTIQS